MCTPSVQPLSDVVILLDNCADWRSSLPPVHVSVKQDQARSVRRVVGAAFGDDLSLCTATWL